MLAASTARAGRHPLGQRHRHRRRRRETLLRCTYLHPQDRFAAPAAMAVPLPEGVPAGRAVLAANMETALNVVWDAGARPGDRIAVVGAGVVGALVAWLCARLPGAEVTLVDVEPGAGGAGGGARLPASPCRMRRRRTATCVFHASASGAGLRDGAGARRGWRRRWSRRAGTATGRSTVPLGGGVPQPAAAARLEPGRLVPAGAAGALEQPAAAGDGAGAARRPGARRADQRRDAPSRICRRATRRSSARPDTLCHRVGLLKELRHVCRRGPRPHHDRA